MLLKPASNREYEARPIPNEGSSPAQPLPPNLLEGRPETVLTLERTGVRIAAPTMDELPVEAVVILTALLLGSVHMVMTAFGGQARLE
jgi:hypothetical protein